MQILHKPLTRKVKRKTKHARLRLDSFCCTIFCHMYPCCWCSCCSYVISLVYLLASFVVSWLSWLSWLSTFWEILDITTLPITRFKKTMRMGHPTAISDRCWCSALSSPWSRSSLLGSAPTGSFRCTAPKKTGQESFAHFVLFINSWSAKACQFQLRGFGTWWQDSTLKISAAAFFLQHSWPFSDYNVVLKLWKHLWRCFQERFWRMFNRFLVNFQGPGLILCPCRHSKTTPAWRWCW